MSYWVPDQVDHNRFLLRANPAGCVGIPGRYAMMGGVTSGAVIDTLERFTGRPLIWSSTQFVSPAPAETDYQIHVEVLLEGRRTSQARGSLFDGDRLVLTTQAALGERAGGDSRQYARPKTKQPPEECQKKCITGLEENGGLFDSFERRLALADEASAFEALWFQPTQATPVCASLIAIIGDFLAGASELTRGSSSLDNALRIHRLAQSDWYLAETQLESIDSRIYHGTMNIFDRQGELLAVASQSGVAPKTPI